MVIELAFGFLIGLALSMLGGGGSILTVPILVYIVGQRPQMAVTASLAIVGLTAMIGAGLQNRNKLLQWRIALLFGSTGIVGSYLAARISNGISETLLMIIFGCLMVVAGGLMARRRSTSNQAERKPAAWPIIVASGTALGAITGFLGVGGGFLIVPTLIMLIGLPMHEAIATSLVVIAMNSAAGLLGHLGTSALDFGLIAVFGVGGSIGSIVGTTLARRIQASRLQQSFAVVIILLGIVVLYQNLSTVLHS